MTRKFQHADMERVMQIWLEGNLQAHGFVPESYWRGNFDVVRGMLPESELYVYEEESTRIIQGFLGLVGENIAGVFVSGGMRSNGIGKQLLDTAKKVRNHLTLRVYQKKTRALSFYLREGFQIRSKETDDSTGEAEYLLTWN